MSKSKGGRPRTDRDTAVTVRLSREAVDALAGEHNKSELIDGLIRGNITRVRCPHCGKVFMIRTKE